MGSGDLRTQAQSYLSSTKDQEKNDQDGVTQWNAIASEQRTEESYRM